MPKIAYIDKRFQRASRNTIEQANDALESYREEGYIVTLRQLYYRMLSRGMIPENTLAQYKRLGKLMSDARLSGNTDWAFMEDRIRNLQGRQHWRNPESIINACVPSYGINLWEGQKHHVEVWFEKDALMGVFAPVCRELDVSYFSCRGYSSQSEMWSAGQRLLRAIRRGQTPCVLYLGDHDPSGIQMTEDIAKRLMMYCGEPVEVARLALTMDQVREFDPPPNFAKETDSRYASYVSLYGEECWELDALEPKVLGGLVEDGVEDRLDRKLFDSRIEQQEHERRSLRLLSEHYYTALAAANAANARSCEHCGNEYQEDESDAGTPGRFCSENCEGDYEDASES